jgi:hypothetical protein
VKRGAKVKEGDVIPEDMGGKHGYPNGTVRLGDRITINVSSYLLPCDFRLHCCFQDKVVFSSKTCSRCVQYGYTSCDMI